MDVVIHGTGAAAGGPEGAEPGSRAAVSGPARGYTIDEDAPGFFLAGDETAIPAISQLLERLPADTARARRDRGRRPSARHAPATASGRDRALAGPAGGRGPGDALVAAVGLPTWPRERGHGWQGRRRPCSASAGCFFEERGLPRAHATVRGYWKHGRRGDADADQCHRLVIDGG